MTTKDLLNEAFEDDDELTDTRVFAHLTVYFADIEHMIYRVFGKNASKAMTSIRALIVKEFTALEKADKKKAEEAITKKVASK